MSTTPHSFTLRRPDAALIADVILSASTTDLITPIICGGHIKVEEGNVTAVGTDRYRVHTATVTATEATGDHDFVIPRSIVAWLKRNLTVFGRDQLEQQVVTFSNVEGGALTVVVADPLSEESVTFTGKATKGNYPPVARLFEKAREAEPFDGEVRLNLNFLGKAAVLGNRHDAPIIKLTKSDNPNKAGVAYLAFHGQDRDGKKYIIAEALVQPNLMLR
jgi:hypothetical protein